VLQAFVRSPVGNIQQSGIVKGFLRNGMKVSIKHVKLKLIDNFMTGKIEEKLKILLGVMGHSKMMSHKKCRDTQIENHCS
jgi:hypothetical protein